MPRVLSAAIGLVVLVSAGCTAQTNTTSEPAVGPAMVDLVTASGFYPARRHVVEVAEEELVQRCMAGRGKAYQPFVPPLVKGTEEERVVDMPRRRIEGYGLSSAGSSPPRAAPGADQPGYQQALFGDEKSYQELPLPDGSVHAYPTTGCVAESRAALYGDVTRWARVWSIPPIFDNELRRQVHGAAEVVQSGSRWAACMAQAGYPYATPEAAMNDVSTAYRGNGETPGLRTHEIALATADGECTLKVHAIRIELHLRRARVRSLPAETQRALAVLATIHCAAYHNALRFTSGRATDC